MNLLRASLAGLLALCMTLSGLGAAYAAGQSPARDRIVLCTGHGPVAVYVDEDGTPTTAPELCADCAPVLLAPPASVTLPARAARVVPVAPVPPRRLQARAAAHPVRARGPPEHLI